TAQGAQRKASNPMADFICYRFSATSFLMKLTRLFGKNMWRTVAVKARPGGFLMIGNTCACVLTLYSGRIDLKKFHSLKTQTLKENRARFIPMSKLNGY